MKKCGIVRRMSVLSLAIALVITAVISYHDRYWRKQRHILIVGCSRSGTTYIAQVLRECGYKIGHEIVKRDGVCSWEMTVDTKKVPWGHGRNGRRFKHIFHQVRDPLKVIASLYTTEPPQSFEFIRTHIPEIKEDDSHLTQCAKFWYYWNLKAEAQAEWTYRIEELGHVWNEFERRFGRKLDTRPLAIISKNTNTRGKHAELTWKELREQIDSDVYHKIQDLAQKYGYSLDET